VLLDYATLGRPGPEQHAAEHTSKQDIFKR